MRKTWSQDTAKLNAVELTKLEKDGLDIIDDLPKLIEGGFAALGAADFDRLKWLGLYAQRPKTDGFFMLRVKIPGGVLLHQQAQALAEIAEIYGRQTLDITTRQSIQFHWLRLEDLPDIFSRLEAVGLTTLEAAGDCPRNIVTSPIAGIDPEEIIDPLPIVEQLNQFFHNNREFSNLPRKFKIAVSGSADNPVNAELNDLSFVPAQKTIDGKVVNGFHVLVGGGLSHQPHLAIMLDIFVLPNDALKVASAVATIFRDYGYREKRNHARLKFLLADWGKQKFTREIVKLTGSLLSKGTEIKQSWSAGKYLGIARQKQAGFYYFGLVIPAGRISSAGLREIAEFAITYGNGELRTTGTQNIIIPNISEEKLSDVRREPLYISQQQARKSIVAHTVVCTGKEFCPYALVETKQLAKSVAEHLDKVISLDEPVRIHFSGCGHSCGQVQIADIGLQGSVALKAGKPYEAFDIWAGGFLGSQAQFGAKIAERIPLDDLIDTLVRLLKLYKKNRLPGEDFSRFAARCGYLKLDDKLTG
ncbi:MAG: nitrite/sulfite reductase [Negativicutes bacterium]|nr:nitrite/sulfite reductase [Negativicutes bacterium]